MSALAMVRSLRSSRLRTTKFLKRPGKAKQVSTSRRVPSHAPSPRSLRARWHEHGARVPSVRGGQLSHGCQLGGAWRLHGGGAPRAHDDPLPACDDGLLPSTFVTSFRINGSVAFGFVTHNALKTIGCGWQFRVTA